MTVPFRGLRKALRRPVGASAPHHALRWAASRAEVLVTAYYAASVYLAAQLIYSANGMGRSVESWDLLWPLAWAQGMDMKLVGQVLALTALVSALAAVQFRHFWPARAAFVVSFFLVATLVNSTGGINHPYHAWVWVGVVFAFLPDGRISEMNRAGRLSYVTVFVTAQIMFMLFYTMAGLWKIILGLVALRLGIPGNLSFEALSWTIADRTLQTGTDPLLADLVISNPVLAWPGFMAVMYVQVFAVLAPLRPRLCAAWGYALIAFHIGTWLLMEIIFTQHVLLLVLLMVLSPTSPVQVLSIRMLRDLPIIAAILRFQEGRGAVPARERA